MLKKTVLTIALAFLLTFSGVVLAGEVGIIIHDEEVCLGFPPVVQDGQTVVPVRPLFEALNAVIAWDSENMRALGMKGDQKVLFITADQTTPGTGSTNEAVAEVPALKIQNRIFAPLRPTAESLGFFVEWNELTRTIAISGGEDDLPAEIHSDMSLLQYVETETIDINSATFWELFLLQGIDEQLAGAIINYRDTNGLFEDYSDIKNVAGVDDQILKELQKYTRLIYYDKGYATSYGGIFHGRRTASGEIYDKYASTAAHPTLPFDTMVKVTFLDTGKSTWVRINDRGPCQVRHPDRIIDLSRSSAYEIGLTRAVGVGEVELKIVKEY